MTMLACRPRPRRVIGFSVFNFSTGRSNSISASSPTSPAGASASTAPADKPQDSIFTAPESPWDHVFSDIEPISPLSSHDSRLRARLNDTNDNTWRRKSQGQLVQRSSGVRQQRASITARETRVFNEMFDLIFNAMSDKSGKAPSRSVPGSASASPLASAFATPYVPSSAASQGQMPAIGRAGHAPLNDVFRTLRRQTSRVRWTTAIDEELDRKKETMELFDTDYDLLQWVTTELFGESRQWDETAKGAIAASGAGVVGTTAEKGKGSCAPETGVNSSTDAVATSSPSSSTSTPSSTPSSSSTSSAQQHPINHSVYPHLIAHAMRLFRKTYSNPSLSLAIFNHAARVSIPSYVFGCTAPAYNELIEAKWEGWGDLEGVCNALEEMRANGVKIDGRTRMVVEKVRREVGMARPVGPGEPGQGTEEGQPKSNPEGINPLARKVWIELEEAGVMGLLHRIERLALRDRSRNSTSSPHDESWKSAALQSGEDDEWSFDGWDKAKKTGTTKKLIRKGKHTSRDKIYPRTLDDWAMADGPEEMAFR